jgi:aquaporin Z
MNRWLLIGGGVVGRRKCWIWNCIPVTKTSVNPARSTGVALFVGDWAIAQLWLFWVAPIIGAVLGALVYRLIGESAE